MNSKKHTLKVLALAFSLPSTIIGVFLLAYQLVQRGLIEEWQALLGALVVIANSLFLMVRYGIRKKDKS